MKLASGRRRHYIRACNRNAFLPETIGDTPLDRRDLAELTAAAWQAGELVMGFFRQGRATSAQISHKAGGSPVTEADFRADEMLNKRLRSAFPGAAWLSEETADDKARLGADLVIVVDPIDGTRAFSTGDPRFCIAVALVANGRPIAGVIHAPALGETHAALKGEGATLNGAPARVSARRALAGASLSGPRWLSEEMVRSRPDLVLVDRIPSLACRIAAVASGALDASLAAANAHDWDLAAADLILHEAGGLLTGLEGAPLVYNRADVRHPELVAAPVGLHGDVMRLARAASSRGKPA